MQKKPTLVVLAAGLGSRYGGLKQIDPVGPSGETILDYSIFDAIRAGFGKIVLVISEEMQEEMNERMRRTIAGRCQVELALQKVDMVPAGFDPIPDRSKPWGTAHATWCCKDLVREPFVVINADDFYGRSSFQISHDFLIARPDRDPTPVWCMVGWALQSTLTGHGHVSRGICSVDDHGLLLGIEERLRVEMNGDAVRDIEDDESWTEISGDSIVSMNFWGLTPVIFDRLEAGFAAFLEDNQDDLAQCEYLLPTFIGELIKAQQAVVKVLPTAERWFGVTYQNDRPAVVNAIADLVRQGVYPEQLWGVRV